MGKGVVMKIVFDTKDDFNQYAVKTIKRLRKSLGISQDELAEKLGTTQSRVSYLESGKSNLTISMFQKVIVNLIS